MARFPGRAALLSLILLSSASVAAGLASSGQCQIGTGTANNVFWDTCQRDGCCPRKTGTTTKLLNLGSNGEATGCCSDTDSACGDGMTCCGYGTSTKADIIDWYSSTSTVEVASSCVKTGVRGCCQYTVLVQGSGGTAPSRKKARKTYDMATEECCADAVVHNDYRSASGLNFPIVKKGQSCNYNMNKNGQLGTSTSTSDWVKMKQNSARCETNTDCKTGTCCRRAKYTGASLTDNAFTSGEEDALGVCMDDSASCCAGSAASILVDAGTTSSSTKELVGRKYEKNARAYDANHEQCCKVTGQVIGKKSACPCSASDDCNNGGSCCKDSNPMVTRSCEAGCARGTGTESSTTAPGCMGTCSVPGTTTCWGCGTDSSPVADAQLKDRKCCEATSSERRVWTSKPSIQAYTCTSANCCPAGTLSGSTASASITGSTCACWSDSDCNGGWTCCNTRGASNADSYTNPPGQCINPKTTGCCAVTNQDARETFDLTTDICCPLVGKVSGTVTTQKDLQCSCQADGDCQSGFECCRDAESTGTYMDKQAGGKCIHTETQECCDDPSKREGTSSVEVCFKEYEKCCAGSCCHSELDSCRKADWAIGLSGGVLGSTNSKPVSAAKFKEEQERCQKRMTPAIVFMAWVLPVFLTIFGLAALLGAIKVAFDAAMEERGVKSLRVALIVMGALAHICLTLMLWSMFWQIAIFAMGCNIFIIAVIKTENPWARRMGMFVAFLITVIIVSPYTNEFFSFGVEPRVDSSPGYHAPHGLQQALMWHSREFTNCGKFYQWFTAEQLRPYNSRNTAEWLVDGRLHNVKAHTWGLCMWEWQQAVAVIGGLYICFQILFSMAAFAIFSRKMNSVAASKVVVME